MQPKQAPVLGVMQGKGVYLCVYLLCPLCLGCNVDCSRVGLQGGYGLLVACGTGWNDAHNLLLYT